MTQIKNFTPHPIVLLGENKEVIFTFQPEGLVRLKASTVKAGAIALGSCAIPITKTQFGEAEGLPDPVGDHEPEIFYIVSQLVKTALPNRRDLLVPAEVCRDANGNIIGCQSFGI